MKKFLFAILLFGLFSCGNTTEKETPVIKGISFEKVELPGQGYGIGKDGYQIFVIDSCEYIYAWFGNGYGGGSITHKGNCKFCRERNIHTNDGNVPAYRIQSHTSDGNEPGYRMTHTSDGNVPAYKIMQNIK